MTAVFKKALRDSRNLTLWLSIGLGLYAVLVISFYPAMVKESAQFNDLLKSYPEAMLKMFYGDIDVESLDITEPGGFIHSQFAIWMLLILGGIAIMQTFGGITSAERDGTMDMMMSLPISRRHYFLARVASTIIIVLLVLTVSFLGFVLSTLIWPEFDVSVGDLALGIYGAFFPLMVITGFTYLLAAVIPSSKRFAGPIAYLFLIGSYLVYGLSGAVKGLDKLQRLLIYDYYNVGDLIRNGVVISDWLILTAVALVCLGLAWWFIDQKELGV